MRPAIALLICLLVSACAPPPAPLPTVQEVRQAIEETNTRFTEAFNKGDAATVATFYTENAMVFPPNGELQRGRSAIQEQMAEDIAAYGLSGLKLTTSDVEVYNADTASETGNFSINVTLPGGGTIEDRGKFVVIWKKQADGSWKLHRDIWNSSMPMPEPPPPPPPAKK